MSLVLPPEGAQSPRLGQEEPQPQAGLTHTAQKRTALSLGFKDKVKGNPSQVMLDSFMKEAKSKT